MGKAYFLLEQMASLWLAKLKKTHSSSNPARKNLGAKLDAENPCPDTIAWV